MIAASTSPDRPDQPEPAREVVTIVGAGPGLGAAIAHRFGADGAAVALLARTPERLDDLVADLEAAGTQAFGVSADAADPDSLRAGLTSAADRLGNPTILVYNASRYVGGAPTSVDVHDLVGAFMVGVAGALVAVQEVVPGMRGAGRGTILLTGGGTALTPFVGSSALGVAKAGLRNLTFSLADELEPAGIHVAMVTVDGVIGQTEQLAPQRLAEAYATLHAQRPEQWEREVVLR